MTLYVRVCPACEGKRPVEENDCANTLSGNQRCGFPLLDIHPTPIEPPVTNGSEPEEDRGETPDDPDGSKPDKAPGRPLCPNGHAVALDDVLCLECGARVGAEPTPPGESSDRTIGGWRVVAELPGSPPDAELFLARREDGEDVRVLRHFRTGFESHMTVLRALTELVDGAAGEILTPLPQAKSLKAKNTLAIQASAAIFLAEFASQAIANDLRQLGQKPLAGVALECLLRLQEPEVPPPVGQISHLDRYTPL